MPILSAEERVLLFKSPVSDPYAQALLTVIGLPSGVRFKLTTYRSIWVPPEIFEQCEKLEGKKAILVCVDTVKEPASIKGAYPLRELTIVHSRQLGQQLALLVEIGGFVVCPDYAAYLAELQKSHQLLPPNEHSFIAYDKLRNLTVIPPEDINRSLSAWQNSIKVLVEVQGLQRAGFFHVTGVKREPDEKAVDLCALKKDDLDAASCTYQLTENSRYRIELFSMLPRHSEREGLGYLELQVQYPNWAEGQTSLEISGYAQPYSIKFRTIAVPPGSYPNSVAIKPEDPTFKRAPAVELYFNLMRAPLKVRAREFIRQRGPRLVLAVLAALAYLYGQLTQSMKAYPTFKTLLTLSPELAGAFTSTVALVVLTYMVSLVMGGTKES